MTLTLKTVLMASALAFALPAIAAETPAAPPTDPAAPPPTLPGDPATDSETGAAPVAAPAPTAADVDAQLDTLFGSHEPYKTFLTDLQKATLDEDKKAVAAMVSYPFTTKVGDEDKTFENAKDFIAAYDDIFTPATLLAIKTQTYETLFANAQGIMIGDSGQLWASEIMTDEPEPKSQGVKIIAINHL